MNTVYTAAFLNGRFLMVFNPKRDGWEMPGGHMENGETPEEAAEREFMEESGYIIRVIDRRRMWDSWGCVAVVQEKTGDGEMESEFFDELPERLAFQKAEYDEMLQWARSILSIPESQQCFYRNIISKISN